jgi:hypothetical protein
MSYIPAIQAYDEMTLNPFEDDEFLPRRRLTPAGLPSIAETQPVDAPAPAIPELDRKRDAQPMPMPEKPKGWQRALAGIVGGLGGYVNAGGRTQVDTTDAVEGILRPGYKHQVAEWKANRDAEDRAASAAVQDEQLKLTRMQREAQREQAEATREFRAYQKARYAQQPDKPATEAEMRADREAFAVAKKWDTADPSVRGWIASGNYTVTKPEKADKPSGHWVEPGDGTTVYIPTPDSLEKPPTPIVFKGTGKTKTAPRAGAAEVALPEAPAFSANPGEHNEEWLKKLPTGFRNQVKAVVEGRYPVPTGAALRSPQIQRLLEAAATYEPGFDLTQWQTRLSTRRDFAVGKAATNIRSLNTLVDHVGKLMDSTNELDNSGFRVGNWVWNAAQSQFGGNPKLKKWGIDAQAVVSEAVSLFKGTGATDQEINALRSGFDPNAPMSEQVAAAKEVIQLAFGRLAALDDQYQNAFRKPRDFKFLSPKAMKVLKEKLGLDPDALDSSRSAAQTGVEVGGTVKMRAPNGQETDVPADQVEHFKQRGAVVVGGR